jgi:hypothetical protein
VAVGFACVALLTALALPFIAIIALIGAIG